MSRVGAALMVAFGLVAACSGATPVAAAPAGVAVWLDSIKGSAAQNQQVSMVIPPTFGGATLLVAVTADDGPDTVPVGSVTSATHAVFGGNSGLKWVRRAHVSARHDVALPGDQLEKYGACRPRRCGWRYHPNRGIRPGRPSLRFRAIRIPAMTVTPSSWRPTRTPSSARSPSPTDWAATAPSRSPVTSRPDRTSTPRCWRVGSTPGLRPDGWIAQRHPASRRR